MKRASASFCCFSVALFALGTTPRSASADDKLSFNRDIRSILSNNCFACHGPDAKNAETELRLDLRDGVAKADGTGVIVPGKPGESEFIRRINAEDAAERMPPESTHKTLTKSEKDLFARWITEGAEYQSHWAFVKPERPEPPQVSGQKSAFRNPIDNFIAERLQREVLTMSPETDKTTLLRRVTFDLTGLPPTIAEVDAFLADTSEHAYEKVVDRLLASPHFGERMAMWWLDGARYADSNGYQKDDERSMWRWRDWVIEAFNRNQPFDQFTIEQLAGDLLPNATLAQKIATGFNRNHRQTDEGGSIAEEWRVEGVIDRVETTSAVWMALTMGCARCHDHKYDPLPQKEFYQFFAFFNNVPENGMAKSPATPPFIRAPQPDEEAQLAKLDAELAAANTALEVAKEQQTHSNEKWEAENAPKLLEVAKSWQVLTPTASSAGKATFVVQPDGSLVVTGAKPATDAYTLTATLDKDTTITGIQLEVLPHPGNAAQSFGRVGNGNIVLGEFDAEIVDAGMDGTPRPLKLSGALADYSQPNWDIAATLDDNSKTGWALNGNDPAKRLARHALFLPEQPISLPLGGTLIVNLRMEALANHNIGNMRLVVTREPGVAAPNADVPRASVVAALGVPQDKRSKEQTKVLDDFFRTRANDSAVAQAKAAVDAATLARNGFENSITTVMVMQDTPQPHDCFVLVRGQYDAHGEKVTAGLPAALPPMPEGQPMNRLGLARWLVDPSHPLTARVQVNRYWELLFGVGLCKSSENFGMQSEFPSHPALLDWLATEYIRLGWDTKAMLKTMLMSATYRQSSNVTPQLLERDPENRLLARGPRFRVQAEFIRDNALAVSGLLVNKLGGKSVRPYQPNGIWDEVSVYGNLRGYKPDQGEGLYRRSMYTIWKRTCAPPNLLTFDMPGRELCVVHRSRTNTPLQALSLLNEETYVEAARNLAQRMLLEGDASPEARVVFAFRLATGRKPSDRERQTLLTGLNRNLEKYRSDSEGARKLISIGASKADAKLDPSELAAYTITASVILNLDEAITKE